LGTAEALYYARPSRAVKQQFNEYFMCGVNISEAIRAHQDYLEPSKVISGKKKKYLCYLYSKPQSKNCYLLVWSVAPKESRT